MPSFLKFSLCWHVFLILSTHTQCASVIVDSSPPSPGVLLEDMSWSSAGGTASIHFQGFFDSHTPIVKYYVSINGQETSIVPGNNPDFTVTVPAAGLAVGKRYRAVVRAVNSGGVAVAVTGTVEAHPSGSLNVLHEVCPSISTCTLQYRIAYNETTQNGCSAAPDSASSKKCMCTVNVAGCVSLAVDERTVADDVWNNLHVEVRDGFSPGQDINYQPFTNVLGVTWEVCFCGVSIVSIVCGVLIVRYSTGNCCVN